MTIINRKINTNMYKKLNKFGSILKELRIKKELGLREVCQIINYDPSNWSKIERGKIPPPSDEKVLRRWAKSLGLSGNERKIQEFIDKAKVTQGTIPQDILSKSNAVEYLPAFFRTLRNKKLTKEEIDRLMELIMNA